MRPLLSQRDGVSAGPRGRPLTGNQGGSWQVAAILKANAQHAGLDPKQFAGHALRSRFLTDAATRGALIFKMADQSRHKSMDTLRGYVRDAKICKDHAGTGLF